MQRRIEKLIILKIYNDETSNFSYVKVLTMTVCESIRLSQSQARSKISHLLQPFFLLEVELVKTTKNWILNEVINANQIIKPNTYLDFQKIADLQKILSSRIETGQDTDILASLLEYFSQNQNLDQIDQTLFDNYLLSKLGFLEESELLNPESVSQSKYSNHL